MSLTEPTTEVIGLTLVRGTSPDLEWIEVEGETIVWSESTQELHRLDPIATLIFRLCDGRSTVADTVEDLARSFAVPSSEVTADIEHCVRWLLATRLVHPAQQ